MDLENTTFEIIGGTKIVHDVFGQGTVVDVIKTSSGPAANIQFDKPVAYRDGTPKSSRTILLQFLSIPPVCPKDIQAV